jgi:hypothetical protein
MRDTLNKIRLVFSETDKSIDLPIKSLENILASAIFIALSMLFLINNPLSPDVLSLNMLPFHWKLDIYSRVIISVLTQFLVIFIPFFVVLGKKGIILMSRNIVLIQFINFIIVLIGFIYESAFWPLYKLLPISGLTAQSVFDAIFLLYPLLIMIIFRYILLWMIAIKSGTTSTKTILLILIHSAICFGVWLIGGIL